VVKNNILPLENKINIFSPLCNIRYIFCPGTINLFLSAALSPSTSTIFQIPSNKRGRGIANLALSPTKTTVKISALCLPLPHISLTQQSMVQ